MTPPLLRRLPAVLSTFALLAVGIGIVVFSTSATGQAPTPTCTGDASGDVVEEDGEEGGGAAPVDEPRADLIELCATDGGGSVTLSARTTATQADLALDVADTEGTYTSFGVDVDGDGRADREVVAGLEVGEQVEAVVVDSASGDEVCAGIGIAYADRTTTVEVPRDCLGAPEELRVGAVSSLDADGDFGDTSAAVDAAPDAGFLTVAAEQPSPVPTTGPSVQPTPQPIDSPLPTAAPADRSTDRLAGDGRIGTAIAISGQQFPDGSARVYLARADDLADAVAGGTLSDGPILLVPTCGEAPAEVRAEIDRLDPDEVVALGGTAAICDDVLASAASGRSTDRIGGTGRIQTAALIARQSFPQRSDDVFLARADVVVDAVAGGALTGGPILLVPTCGEVPDDVSAEIDRLAPQRVAALGGTAAVCDALLADASDVAGVEPARLGGDDRFATAVAISADEFDRADRVYLARADNPADAVAGGALTDGPVLVVPSCGELPEPVAAEIQRLNPTTVVALGGPQAICDQLLQAAAQV